MHRMHVFIRNDNDILQHALHGCDLSDLSRTANQLCLTHLREIQHDARVLGEPIPFGFIIKARNSDLEITFPICPIILEESMAMDAGEEDSLKVNLAGPVFDLSITTVYGTPEKVLNTPPKVLQMPKNPMPKFKTITLQRLNTAHPAPQLSLPTTQANFSDVCALVKPKQAPGKGNRVSRGRFFMKMQVLVVRTGFTDRSPSIYCVEDEEGSIFYIQAFATDAAILKKKGLAEKGAMMQLEVQVVDKWEPTLNHERYEKSFKRSVYTDQHDFDINVLRATSAEPCAPFTSRFRVDQLQNAAENACMTVHARITHVGSLGRSLFDDSPNIQVTLVDEYGESLLVNVKGDYACQLDDILGKNKELAQRCMLTITNAIFHQEDQGNPKHFNSVINAKLSPPSDVIISEILVNEAPAESLAAPLAMEIDAADAHADIDGPLAGAADIEFLDNEPLKKRSRRNEVYEREEPLGQEESSSESDLNLFC